MLKWEPVIAGVVHWLLQSAESKNHWGGDYLPESKGVCTKLTWLCVRFNLSGIELETRSITTPWWNHVATASTMASEQGHNVCHVVCVDYMQESSFNISSCDTFSIANRMHVYSRNNNNLSKNRIRITETVRERYSTVEITHRGNDFSKPPNFVKFGLMLSNFQGVSNNRFTFKWKTLSLLATSYFGR